MEARREEKCEKCAATPLLRVVRHPEAPGIPRRRPCYSKDMKIKIPSHLTDADLTAELKRLVGCEREKTVLVVAHLVEFDARRLYLGAGFPSLYTYCRGVLRMSEYESYHRIKAARAARKFPVILEKLGEACLTLATVRLLASHLTRENHQDLIAQASGKSKRQVEELLARLFPQPDLPTRLWKLPSPAVMSDAS
jgi:hypothetical protein